MSPLSVPAVRVRGAVHLAVFFTLVAGITFATYRAYVDEREVFSLGLHRQLSEIATLTSNQLLSWQQERRGDAMVAASSAGLMPDLERAVGLHPEPEAQARAIHWLEAVRNNYQYSSASLTDTAGAIEVNSGQELAIPLFYQTIGREVSHSQGIFVRYYPRDLQQVMKSHWVIGAPLRSPSGQPVGSILFAADPWQYPFPVALKWPSATNSGRVWMIRQEGPNVRAIGYASGMPGQPMESIISLSDRNSPFVQAIYSGNGMADGVNPSGGRSAASTVAGPVDSGFQAVLAMIDEDEAYRPLQRTKLLLIFISALLVALCGGGVGWIWRQQVLESYRQRLNAEKERRALVGHYDYLARFANDAIILATSDGQIVQVNERVSDFFGYSHEELLQMNVRQLRGANTEEEYRRAQAALDERQHFVFETTGVRKDGTDLPVELSIRMIQVESDRYRQTIVRDITERRRAAEQISRLNRLYAVLSRCGQAIVKARDVSTLFQEVCHVAVESGGFRLAAIRVPDPGTGHMTCAARAGDALAYSDAAGEVVPLSLISVSSIRESGARVCNDIWGEPSLAAARENAIKFNVRSLLVLPLWRGSKPAGELTLYSAEPGFFNQEELELATEIAESISFALESLERKQQQQNTEAELRDNRERLELVLDAAEEAYWDWDLESERLQQSPRYDAMLGYGPNEVPRGYQSMLSMTHPEDGDRLNREYLAFRTSDKDSMSNEFRMRCKAGEYIWVFARSKIVARNASGKPTRMVGTLTEITDRKRLEDQFRQAQKLESVGRLAGGVAHDFNNLLTVINGYSKLLLARLPQNDPGRQQLEEIRKAGERGEGLTKQLLAFSRKQVTEPRLLKLNDAAGESEAMLRRLVPTNVEFRAFYGARNDEVVTDPSQVHQILMNLVVNACDAMPTGGNLTVQTANVLLDKQDAAEDSGIKIGQHVLLTVSDTGTGMDDETLRHIFEPFFTTKDVGKGTGLGLSTVYGIVQQCGGFVQAESTIGQGTTFKIYLPVAAEGIRPDSTVQPAASTELIGAETILVVEDQESVRNLAVDTLRAYGYSVIAAPGGVDALRLASKHKGPIHLLLTDIMMPSMNGKTLAGEIRRVRPETKVIYMSGYADATVVGSPAGELNPDTAYLQKPFLPEALGIKVRQTLMHRAIRRTVLVVEDESAIRDLFMEFLGGRHNVLLASNGAEALRLLRSQADIDLVITDLVMPDQEGIDVIRGARKLRPGLKVIAMSGAFGGKFLKTAELLGADATLVKPVRPEVLDQVIEEVLGRSA